MKKIGNFFQGFFSRKNNGPNGSDKISDDQKSANIPEKQSKNKILIKCLLVGESEVGKSSLAYRFVEGKYDDDKKVVCENQRITSRLIDNYTVDFIINDPDYLRFRRLSSSDVKSISMNIICYDVNNSNNLNNLLKSEIAYLEKMTTDDTRFCVVGTKDDANQYSSEPYEISQFRDNHYKRCMQTGNLPYSSISAKNGRNVEELFHNIAKICIETSLAKDRMLSYREGLYLD